MTVATWHGWHYSEVENFQETRRLGSIHPEAVDRWGDRPARYDAAGIYHRLAHFCTFAEAKVYLEGRGNRAPVDGETWSAELYS